jgi:hypothetical protein
MPLSRGTKRFSQFEIDISQPVFYKSFSSDRLVNKRQEEVRMPGARNGTAEAYRIGWRGCEYRATPWTALRNSFTTAC